MGRMYMYGNIYRIYALLAYACLLFSSCGPAIPVFDARLGLSNGPTEYNITTIISWERLDNSDFVWKTCNIRDDLRRSILNEFPTGVDAYVVVGVDGNIVYVDYEVRSDNYCAMLLLGELSDKLRAIRSVLGIYNNKYVPYSMYLRVGPESDMIISR